jgi:hypothetical protein
MIIDCNDGAITTSKLLKENQLGDVTERAGDFCGSTEIHRTT